VLNFEPKHPASSHPLDLEAAAVAHEQFNRWYLDPITGHGYPEDGARAWGWRRDEVLEGDMEAIAAPIDFVGVNYYCRDVVRSPLLPSKPWSTRSVRAKGSPRRSSSWRPGRALSRST
jgi:beta-glucosidase